MAVYLLGGADALGSDFVRRALPLLPAERRERVQACRRAADAARLSAAWLLLAWAARREWGWDELPATERARGGKPQFAGEAFRPFCFNLSHSGAYAACALAKAPVGIDVQERVRGVDAALIRKVCSEREASAAATPEGFTRLWTRKEAVVKLLGTGLAEQLPTLFERHPDAMVETMPLDGGRAWLSVAGVPLDAVGRVEADELLA